MCTDFTSLNKVCPNDFYPLPCLGQLVDGSTYHEVFDFMDTSRRYHQIIILQRMRKKPLSSLNVTYITGKSCHLDSRMVAPHISGW
ncbi:hypothetical protein LIER_19917 [Lithospermum erythrorhizon]|uniref:Uncharacterized protein n=1 Tax=Lithospermum erythrorhizon TaxID=34254 RepID=A0AAV3QKF7_LITER